MGYNLKKWKKKKFSGEWYQLYKVFTNEKSAKENRDNLMKAGNRVRIVKTRDPIFNKIVYIVYAKKRTRN